MRQSLRHLVLWLVALPGLVAAAPSPVQENEREATLRYYVAAAEVPGDALSDAFLAKLIVTTLATLETGPGADPALSARAQEISRQLAMRAADGMDRDPTLLAVELGCLPEDHARPGCEQRLARLAELAGDNAYHHVVLMGHAWARKDDAGFLRHARLAAQAPDYRHDLTRVFAILFERFSAVPEHVEPVLSGTQARYDPAGMTAMSIAAALALPAYQHFVQPCREAEGELAGYCLAIAQKMVAESDVAIDLHIAQAVIAVHGSEAAKNEVEERQRRVNWQAGALVDAERRFDRRQWRRYFAAYAEEGERGAFEYVVRALDLPPQPRDDWRLPGEAGAP